MIFFCFSSVAVFLLCLQTTILNHLPFLPVKPDLTIIMVAYVGIFHPDVRGLLLAFTLGYVLDVLSGNMTGLYSLLRIFTFVFIKLSGQRFYLKTIPAQFLLITLLSLVDGIFLLSILNAFKLIYDPWPFLLTLLPAQAVVTGLTGPIIFFLLKINRFTR